MTAATAPVQKAALPIAIRPHTDTDYPAAVALWNASFPDDPESEKSWRFHDAHRDPKTKWQRFVGEDPDGNVVAAGDYGQSAGMYHPRKFGIGVTVHPGLRGRGLGTQMYHHLLAALEPFAPIALNTDAPETLPQSVAFLTRRGFVETMREWESWLDVAAFDFARFDGAEEKVENAGVALRSLADLAGEPDRDRKFYDLYTAVQRDIPSPDAVTPVPFDTWRHRFDNPDFLPEGNFVAVDGATGAYVGMSVLWNLNAGQIEGHVHTGQTGVRREWRRRGIALALKLRAIRYAKATDRRVIRTFNATTNQAMLGINQALGFVRRPAWISFTKTLRPENTLTPFPFLASERGVPATESVTVPREAAEPSASGTPLSLARKGKGVRAPETPITP